jgi:hypothetical protein
MRLAIGHQRIDVCGNDEEHEPKWFHFLGKKNLRFGHTRV